MLSLIGKPIFILEECQLSVTHTRVSFVCMQNIAKIIDSSTLFSNTNNDRSIIID